MTDATHDPARRSWVPGADSHEDFPIQNLPLGIFSPSGSDRRGGVAIGDWIFDLREACAAGLFNGVADDAALAASGTILNPFMALGAAPGRALRKALSFLLDAKGEGRGRAEPLAGRLLHRAESCTLHLPCAIGDYTDFYAGINHAMNVGRLMRPDSPLLPNYKYLPVGYHGRASSVRPSGIDVRRPNGQRKRPEESLPSYGPSRSLDYELELGLWIGPGNALGSSIPIARASEHLAGLCLLNDWSARDVQGWEYQPLGPFLAKSFHSSISPWVITAEALEPFRVAPMTRPDGDPPPLPYLTDAADQAEGGFDIALEVTIQTDAMRAAGFPPHRLATSNARYLYWSAAQMIAHHASAGCNLMPGDLFGSGTISGPSHQECGSLLELTRGGREPITLPGGETRRFLEDGDEITLAAKCRREGFVAIGFGECRGRILAASSA
jgi:fumarylacetoacetase